MRANYNDDEIIALKEIMKLLAAEISRNTRIIVADLDHLAGCEDAEHKRVCIAQAKAALVNILSHLRYCSWIEAEMTPTRVFADAIANLAELVQAQEKIVEEFRAKIEPVAEATVAAPPPTPEIIIVQPENLDIEIQAIEMDKLANAPLIKTKQ